MGAASRVPDEVDALRIAAIFAGMRPRPGDRQPDIARAFGICGLGFETVFHVDTAQALPREVARNVAVDPLLNVLVTEHAGAALVDTHPRPHVRKRVGEGRG